ncbi:MAG: Na(+)-translocating NADH-quinone reductase subunit F [Bacteroidota bacterium]
MAQLDRQQLHNLAMNIVGKDLENQGYEFLGVNSEFKKNPQFVALRNKKLHFVVVRAISYPDDPKVYDEQLVRKVKEHADKFNAKTFWAGVGLANNVNYDKPVDSEDDYVVQYSGLIEI